MASGSSCAPLFVSSVRLHCHRRDCTRTAAAAAAAAAALATPLAFALAMVIALLASLLLPLLVGSSSSASRWQQQLQQLLRPQSPLQGPIQFEGSLGLVHRAAMRDRCQDESLASIHSGTAGRRASGRDGCCSCCSSSSSHRGEYATSSGTSTASACDQHQRVRWHRSRLLLRVVRCASRLEALHARCARRRRLDHGAPATRLASHCCYCCCLHFLRLLYRLSLALSPMPMPMPMPMQMQC